MLVHVADTAYKITSPCCPTEIPALPPPVPFTDEEEDISPGEGEGDEDGETTQHKFSKPSGPRVKDPYASDDSWFMPITIAVAVFLPVLFCLCRVR